MESVPPEWSSAGVTKRRRALNMPSGQVTEPAQRRIIRASAERAKHRSSQAERPKRQKAERRNRRGPNAPASVVYRSCRAQESRAKQPRGTVQRNNSLDTGEPKRPRSGRGQVPQWLSARAERHWESRVDTPSKHLNIARQLLSMRIKQSVHGNNYSCTDANTQTNMNAYAFKLSRKLASKSIKAPNESIN